MASERFERAMKKDRDWGKPEMDERSAAIRILEAQLASINANSEAERRDKMIQVLASYEGPDEIIPSTEIEDLDTSRFFTTGYRELDDIIVGLAPENLMVVTGHTGHGKTLFCQNMSVRMDAPTLWLSYEMSPQEIRDRFKWIDKDFVFYAPRMNKAYDLVWLERKLVEGLAKELGALCRELKLLARKYEVAIVLVHHPKKTENSTTPPSIQDLRGSSLVAQESDQVIAVWKIPEKQSRQDLIENGEKWTNRSRISVLKNRLTGTLSSFTVMYENYKLNTYESPEVVEERRAFNAERSNQVVQESGTDTASSNAQAGFPDF